MALTHFYLNQVPRREEYLRKNTDKKVEWGGGLLQGE